MTLKKQYASICEAYIDALNKMWDTDAEWVGDGRYDMVEVADCYFSVYALRYIVDTKMSFDDFYDWYHYDMAMHYGDDLGKQTRPIAIDKWLVLTEDRLPKEIWEGWENEYFEKI